MKAYQIELIKRNGTAERHYPRLVTEKLRERYTIDEELAILRQRDEKPEEFARYYEYAEACKREAREILMLEVET